MIEQIDHDRLSSEDRDSYYGPLGGGNPPSPSSKSRFSHNIATLIDQGGLNKKEIQLNLCNIFSIFIFNELYLFT